MIPDLLTLCRYGAFLPRRALPDWPPPTNAALPLDAALEGAVGAALTRLPEPCGLALSGGLDSTAVALFAGPRRAFTLDTGRAPAEASRAARVLGLERELVAVPGDGMLGTPLDEVVEALGAPTHSAAPFGFLALYRGLRARGQAAVLTGDGADELFAGHAYHRAPHPAWAALGEGRATTADALFAAYRAVRGLEAQIAPEGLFTSEYLAAHGGDRLWERSARAEQVAGAAAGIASPADRLRYLDVALRMRPQCVALQERLCRHAGLAYAAPLADPAVVAAALARPIAPGAPPKAALRALVVARLGPAYAELAKEPMFTPTGGRPAGALPERWRDALGPATCRRHGVFRPEAIARLLAGLRPEDRYLPRGLVVAATTHRWLGSPALRAAAEARAVR